MFSCPKFTCDPIPGDLSLKYTEFVMVYGSNLILSKDYRLQVLRLKGTRDRELQHILFLGHDPFGLDQLLQQPRP